MRVYRNKNDKLVLDIIDNTLEQMKGIVGGYIDTLYLPENHLVVVCNDKGKIKDLPIRALVRNSDGEVVDTLNGDFIICRDGGEDFTDVKAEDIEVIEKYIKVGNYDKSVAPPLNLSVYFYDFEK